MALLLLFLPCVFASATSGPIIDLGYTRLLGAHNATTGVDFFGGIRYVQPPLGDLRFREPQPLNERAIKNPPLVDARNWSSICIQQPAAVGFGSEGMFWYVILCS